MIDKCENIMENGIFNGDLKPAPPKEPILYKMKYLWKEKNCNFHGDSCITNISSKGRFSFPLVHFPCSWHYENFLQQKFSTANDCSYTVDEIWDQILPLHLNSSAFSFSSADGSCSDSDENCVSGWNNNGVLIDQQFKTVLCDGSPGPLGRSIWSFESQLSALKGPCAVKFG